MIAYAIYTIITLLCIRSHICSFILRFSYFSIIHIFLYFYYACIYSFIYSYMPIEPHIMVLIFRGGNRAGRAGLGRANIGPGQNRAGLKLARFFRAKILTAQPALKTGPVGPNNHFKAKKNSAGPGRAGPNRARPNLARFFSGQKFNGPARP